MVAERVSVFISHSSQDNAFTQQLVDDLRAAGANVWVDAQGINEGDFFQRINDAFIGREWLILVLTTAALRSAWVQAEVNAALVRITQGTMKGFLPVIAGPFNENEIPALWATYHRIDARVDYQAALMNILVSLGMVKDSYDEPGVITVEPYDPDNPNSSEPYPLAAAIERAQPGDRLMLLPGLYRDEIVIDKPLEIIGRGENHRIILAPESNKSIVINSKQVRITNTTIWIGAPVDRDELQKSVLVNKGRSIASAVGTGAIIVAGGAGVVFAAVNTFGPLFGLASNSPTARTQSMMLLSRLFSDPQKAFNELKESVDSAVSDLAEQFEGGDVKSTIIVQQAAEAFFESCLIRNSIGHGIRNYGRLHVTDSTIMGCRFSGVVSLEASATELENVEIGPNVEDGVRVAGTSNVRGKNCKIMNNRVGVVVTEQGSGVFNGNTMSNNRRGAWSIAEACAPNVQKGHFVE